jgi:hypothetical protein
MINAPFKDASFPRREECSALWMRVGTVQDLLSNRRRQVLDSPHRLRS